MAFLAYDDEIHPALGNGKDYGELVLSASSIMFSFRRLFQAQAMPEKAYKKGHRLYARGLKFCIDWLSAILPTTGPTKVKEEAKAESIGFKEGSGGISVEHNCSFLIALAKRYSRKKLNVKTKSSAKFLFWKKSFLPDRR